MLHFDNVWHCMSLAKRFISKTTGPPKHLLPNTEPDPGIRPLYILGRPRFPIFEFLGPNSQIPIWRNGSGPRLSQDGIILQC